jgi:general secretion pathway protein I
MSKSLSKRDAEGGFTLLEIIVAFTILGFALVALLQAFSSGLQAVSTATDATTAVLRARSKLDEVGTAILLAPGRVDGEFDDGAQWTALIEPYPDPFVRDSAKRIVQPYRVIVTVSWGPARAITLETLKLGSPP